MLKFDANHEYFFRHSNGEISRITRSDIYVLDKDNNVSTKLSTSQQKTTKRKTQT